MTSERADPRQSTEGARLRCAHPGQAISIGTAAVTKLHLDLQFTRYRADNSAIGSFRSLWIVTKEGGRCAVAVEFR
jgi:hypothetical protein